MSEKERERQGFNPAAAKSSSIVVLLVFLSAGAPLAFAFGVLFSLTRHPTLQWTLP